MPPQQQQQGLPQQQPPAWNAPPGYGLYSVPPGYGPPAGYGQPQGQPGAMPPPAASNFPPGAWPSPSPYSVPHDAWQYAPQPGSMPPPYPGCPPAAAGDAAAARASEEERLAWSAANKRKAEAKKQYDLALRQQHHAGALKMAGGKQAKTDGKSTSGKSDSHHSFRTGKLSGLSGLPSLSGSGLFNMSMSKSKFQFSEADSEAGVHSLAPGDLPRVLPSGTNDSTLSSLSKFKPPSATPKAGQPMTLRDEYLTRLLRGPGPRPPSQKKWPAPPTSATPPTTTTAPAMQPKVKPSGPGSGSQSEPSSQANYPPTTMTTTEMTTTTTAHGGGQAEAPQPQGFRPAKPQARKRPLPPPTLLQEPGSTSKQPRHEAHHAGADTVSRVSAEGVKSMLGEEDFYRIRSLIINQQEDFMQQVWELHRVYRLQQHKKLMSRHEHSKDGRALRLDNPPASAKARAEASPAAMPAPPSKPKARPLTVLTSSPKPSGSPAGGSKPRPAPAGKPPPPAAPTSDKAGYSGMPAPTGACQPPPYFPQPYPVGAGWPGATPMGSATTDGSGGDGRAPSHETYMHALMQYYSSASAGKDGAPGPQPGLPPHMQIPMHPFQMMSASAPGGPMAMGSGYPSAQPANGSGERSESGGHAAGAAPSHPPHHQMPYGYGMPPGAGHHGPPGYAPHYAPGYEAMMASWYGPHYAMMAAAPKEASGSVPKDTSGGNPSGSNPEDPSNPSGQKPDTPEDGSTDATGATAAPKAPAEASQKAGGGDHAPAAGTRKPAHAGHGHGHGGHHWWKNPAEVFGSAVVNAVLVDGKAAAGAQQHWERHKPMKGPAKLAHKMAHHMR